LRWAAGWTQAQRLTEIRQEDVDDAEAEALAIEGSAVLALPPPPSIATIARERELGMQLAIPERAIVPKPVSWQKPENDETLSDVDDEDIDDVRRPAVHLIALLA
jgi:hypothetical protein